MESAARPERENAGEVLPAMERVSLTALLKCRPNETTLGVKHRQNGVAPAVEEQTE
jgi:hypothetical protein